MWNEIVAAYRAFDEQVTTLETELARLRKERLDDRKVKNALSQIRAERKKTTLATWKAQSPKVLYNDLENLRMAAESAMGLAYKNNGTLHFKKGIQTVNFSKRFKSGGVKFAELLTELDSRNEKLRRKPLAMRVGVKRESNRSRNKTPLHGHYLVGKSRLSVNFTGVWRCPFFPEAGFVKKVTLVGKISRLKNWQWRLILTVEEPPPKIIPDPSLPVAALDLGYRRFPDYIRFGFVVDSAGNKFELRLPDGNMISAYLKNTIKFLAKKGVEKQYIADLKDYFVWDAAQGAKLEEAKKQLKELSDAAKKHGIEMPEKWREIFTGLVKMRNRGLHNLKKVSSEILEAANAATEEGAKDLLKQIIEIVGKWEEKDIYFETEKEHFRRKFTGRRKLLFRQTVKWLASNYSELIWKEDLKLWEMATKAKKTSRITNAALKESNKFRQWVSLHQLRLFIKEQSAKTPDWLRAGTPADTQSMLICDECDAEIISDSSELMLTCANGHQRDRDERAAAELLEGAVTEILSSAVTVPPYLKDYIVCVV
ncbi:MAG: hypothetical protein ACR2N3_10430 [Pyrinomonadaceae bacterium]